VLVLAPITKRPRPSTLPSLKTWGGGSGSEWTGSSLPLSRSRKNIPERRVTTAPPPSRSTRVVITLGMSSVQVAPVSGSKR
jgi:hypothetical protein